MSEFRPGGFRILPPVIKNLLIINVLVFAAQYISNGTFGYPLEYRFALHYWQSELFMPHQLVTHLFMHGSPSHLIFNMFALWMFGNVLENVWGSKRFLIFYFVCGLGAAVCFLGVQTLQYHQLTEAYLQGQASALQVQRFLYEPVLGASGAIFGVLVAFGMLFPNSLIYLYFFVPIKAKWFVLAYIALELYLGVQNNPGDNVAHFAHLGGAVFGFFLTRYWKHKYPRNYY